MLLALSVLTNILLIGFIAYVLWEDWISDRLPGDPIEVRDLRTEIYRLQYTIEDLKSSEKQTQALNNLLKKMRI